MANVITRRAALKGASATAAAMVLPAPSEAKAARIQANLDLTEVLKINTDKHSPHFQRGDFIFVHFHITPEPGNRIVLQGHAGAMTLCTLIRTNGKTLTVARIDGREPETIQRAHVARVGRVVATLMS